MLWEDVYLCAFLFFAIQKLSRGKQTKCSYNGKSFKDDFAQDSYPHLKAKRGLGGSRETGISAPVRGGPQWCTFVWARPPWCS